MKCGQPVRTIATARIQRSFLLSALLSTGHPRTRACKALYAIAAYVLAGKYAHLMLTYK